MLRRTISTVLLASTASFLVASCARPFDNVPEGFADACYGGKENARRNAVCSQQRLVLSTSAPETEWLILAELVGSVGRTHGLHVLDTSSSTPGYIRTVELYACSAKGVSMSLDKRVYDRAEMNRDGNSLNVSLNTYHDSYDWRPLAEDLTKAVSAKWPHKFEATYPDYQNKGAYPQDSVPTCDE